MFQKTKPLAHSLFNLLRLELDRLPVDKDTLALIRLRPSPFPNLGSELRHHSLIDALQQDAGGLGGTGMDAERNTQLNRVRKADLQRDELLSGVRRSDRGRLGLDGCSVTDTDETQNANMAF